MSFSVPLKRADQEFIQIEQKNHSIIKSPTQLREMHPIDRRLEIIKKNFQVKVYQDGKNPNNKMILNKMSGYAKPGEMVAIMGASGSGKTSLLNILGQRLDLSKGAAIEGSIKCNSLEVKNGDFGKLGAFVMQDDILIETMTPFESFCFEAKLRTNLDDNRIRLKAMQMIQRLQLTSCKDTKIGGFTIKAISGGERKRTSIGYELITEPNLILLDEPTSGLDSSTALRIVQLLKKEAAKGMTIIATIHSPSSEIFQTFDRLILLQEGF